MVYVIYLIVSYKYDEYKINNHINNIIILNESLRTKIDDTKELIDYKSSKAYINKILKQEQNKKNTNEQVLIVTPQQQYEKYTNDLPNIEEVIVSTPNQVQIIDNMSIKQRWIYFLFKNDTR